MDRITTVTVASDTFDLTTLETVKAEFGITDSAEDEKVERWIHSASAAIAGWCNLVFAQETVSEQFRIRCRAHELVLSRVPVGTIDSVVENGTTLAATDYEVDKPSGLLTRLVGDWRSCWSAGKVTVVYTGGYELLGTLPFDVEDACIRLVKFYRAKAEMDPLLRAEEVPGVQRFEYQVNQIGGDGGLPPDVLSLIAPYRRPVIG